MSSIEAVIMQQQLRLAGQVVHMPDTKLHKQVFYSELSYGKQSQGGERDCFKGVCKSTLKRCEIDPNTWEAKLDY